MLLILLFAVALAQVGDDMNPHPPFTPPDDLWEQDLSLPEEQRVIKMTGELYDELVTNRYTGSNLSSTPWVLLFVNKDHLDCKRAMH